VACIILSQPLLLPRELWIPQPTDWAKANLRYARYDLTDGEGLRVWRECLDRAAGLMLPEAPVAVVEAHRERFGAPTLIQPRLGQGVFRLAVTDAYGRACAVTHEHSLPALEAAHIRPYGSGGTHDITNGLLLRSDLHRLFDRGYVTVTPGHRLEVSRQLRDHFSNGKSYYPLHGQTIALPKRRNLLPSADALQWHNEQVFRG
jgi:putative restriction endonuclease